MQRLRLLLVVLLALAVQSATAQRFVQLWKVDAGSNPRFPTANDYYRGATYNAATKHYLVASRAISPRIYVLDANTGNILDSLNMTNVTGGTLPIVDIEATSDGAVYATNLITNSGSDTTFKIYRWASETAAPKVVYQGRPGTARIGDCFDILGPMIAASGNGAASVVQRFVRLNDTTFVLIAPVPIVGQDAGAGIQLMPDGTMLISRFSVGNAIDRVDTTGKIIDSVRAVLYGNMGGDICGIPTATNTFLAVAPAAATNGDGRIVDVSAGGIFAFPVDSTARLGSNSNGNASGDVDYRMDPDGNVTVFFLIGNNGMAAYRLILYDDPPQMRATQAVGTITVNGKMDEPEWDAAIPYLIFGPNAPRGLVQRSVTGGAQVRGLNWDPTYATVKFLWKGKKLYLGIQSTDKSVGSFGDSWEGDGLFMKVKDASGNVNREYKLYYNAPSRAFTPKGDSAVYETGGGLPVSAGYGVGLVCPCSIPYDTTQVDSGYTLELEIRLDSLGYTGTIDTLMAMINIFDPDGYHAGAKPWEGPMSRSYQKTWWGSEWGPAMRKIILSKPTWNDPPVLIAKSAYGTITVNGKLDEPEWSQAKPYLKFGFNPLLGPNEWSVTDGAIVRGTPWDLSHAQVKFLRKDKILYVGIESRDKSVGQFGDSWEGDGLFMKIKDKGGNANREYKLYYNANLRGGLPSADSAVFETGGGLSAKAGAGVGLVMPGTKAYDTTDVDAGYTLELAIYLDSLGYTTTVDTLDVLLNLFDPDGYHKLAKPWEGPDTRTYTKTWWGSEWGPAMRKVVTEKAVWNDPARITAYLASGTMTVDGKLNEPDWANAKPTLVFGANPPLGANDRSVTGGAMVRGAMWDPSYAKVKVLRKGLRMYIGIESPDKSVGSFGDSWEGDGLFMKIRDAGGNANREYKLYFNAPGRAGTSKADTAVYETGGGLPTGAGFGMGLVMPGTKAYDTTTVDVGYTMELEVRLDSLGFAANVDSVVAMFNIFDPDGYHAGAKPWEGPETRSYYKSWWGSEWGPVMRTIKLGTTTDVTAEAGTVPNVFALQQNYPNPFNPTTNVRFDLPVRSAVSIVVYDVIGREVQKLVSGDYGAGSYTVTLDARNMASGVYFYRMISNSLESGDGRMFVETKKLVVLK